MAVLVRSKLKWRAVKIAARHAYRSRTGPTCCSVNCKSNRKKTKKNANLARRRSA